MKEWSFKKLLDITILTRKRNKRKNTRWWNCLKYRTEKDFNAYTYKSYKFSFWASFEARKTAVDFKLVYNLITRRKSNKQQQDENSAMGIIYFGKFQYFDENMKINLDRTNDASSRVESDQFSLSSHKKNHFLASKHSFALCRLESLWRFIQNICNFLCKRVSLCSIFVKGTKAKGSKKLFH